MLVEESLRGKSILVIEDDFVDELALAFEVAHAGIGMPGNVHDQTIALLTDSDVGAAILDGHLDTDKSAPIIAALRELGIPFVISDAGGAVSDQKMNQLSAELTLIAHQLFGAPTFH